MVEPIGLLISQLQIPNTFFFHHPTTASPRDLEPPPMPTQTAVPNLLRTCRPWLVAATSLGPKLGGDYGFS
ncbi:uncharacterized protein DS421_7g213410 [Arachis hypogaea]|nr:uncharacterized protein DS421_7g213410 [Arachis hypogaea]